MATIQHVVAEGFAGARDQPAGLGFKTSRAP